MPLPSEESTGAGRCYWYRDGAGEVLIPMCLGCAVNGPEQCTCDVPESRIEAVERGRAEAEAEVLRLRAKLARAGEKIADELAASQRIRRLARAQRKV